MSGAVDQKAAPELRVDAPPRTALPPAADDTPRTVIAPPRGISLRLDELWAYRELAWFLLLRAVKPRYRQTVLGVGWALIPPLAFMLVFTIFLHQTANVPSARGIPYPLFSYSGLLLWWFFTGAVSRGATSLVGNAAFLTKIYFPRVLIPLSAVLSALFDMAIGALALVPLLAYYGWNPGWELVLVPAWALLATATALAVSLWLTAASVRYRDLSLAVPLVVQLWLFVTPVIYPVTIFPDRYRTLLDVLNPMAPAVEGFRWSILGTADAPGWTAGAGAAIVAVALVSGLLFFNRMERIYADEL